MQFRVSVPGKVILHGEHAVVYGKAAVAVSINLRTEAQVEDCADVVLELIDFKQEFTWPLVKFDQLRDVSYGNDDLAQPTEQLLDKLYKVFDITPQTKCSGSLITFLFLYSAIARKTSGRFIGTRISVSSQLPIGAGLGSSAAYSVAISAAVLRLFGVVDSADGVPPERDLSLISQWAFQSETILHGKPSGIDNSVCTFGGALFFRKGKIQEVHSCMPLYQVLLVNTTIPRNTKALVAAVKSRVERQQKILSAVLDAMDEISAQCWSNLKNTGLTNDQQYQAAAVSASGCDIPISCHDVIIDDAQLQELIAINHQLLNAIGVGHPHLDKMVSLANTYGFSSKLTGAGSGGCGFVLFDIINNSADCGCSTNREITLLKAQLEDQGMHCWQVAMGCPGVTFTS